MYFDENKFHVLRTVQSGNMTMYVIQGKVDEKENTKTNTSACLTQKTASLSAEPVRKSAETEKKNPLIVDAMRRAAGINS